MFVLILPKVFSSLPTNFVSGLLTASCLRLVEVPILRDERTNGGIAGEVARTAFRAESERSDTGIWVAILVPFVLGMGATNLHTYAPMAVNISRLIS